MAIVKPFKAVRPSHDKVHLVSSKSVDNYTPHDLDFVMTHNPYSFLHIIKPEYGKSKTSKPGSGELLCKTKEAYLNYLTSGILINETEDSFYIYQQVKNGITYTGIIGCASIDDYFNGTIKIHSPTLLLMVA